VYNVTTSSLPALTHVLYVPFSSQLLPPTHSGCIDISGMYWSVPVVQVFSKRNTEEHGDVLFGKGKSVDYNILSEVLIVRWSRSWAVIVIIPWSQTCSKLVGPLAWTGWTERRRQGHIFQDCRRINILSANAHLLSWPPGGSTPRNIIDTPAQPKSYVWHTSRMAILFSPFTNQQEDLISPTPPLALVQNAVVWQC